MTFQKQFPQTKNLTTIEFAVMSLRKKTPNNYRSSSNSLHSRFSDKILTLE